MSQANLRVVEGTSVDKTKALDAALSQIERAFGKGSIMRLGKNQQGGRDRDDSDRLARPRHRARRRRPAARPRGRDLRAGILGQDHADPACHRRGAEEGRRLRLRRRRTRARSRLRPQARRQSRRPADLPARHRRAGAGDHRHAGALGRGRRAGDRFGRGADAARRDRGRDGRLAARPAGAADEPGAAQAHRLDLALQHDGHLHQPDPHEDRRHVRLARDHDGRQRAEILRLGAPRHPPHRRDQGPRRGGRQPDPRQGGQEQGRAAVQAGRVRHHVRRGRLQGRRAHRSRRQGRRGREVGRLVLLRQPAPRPGPRERQGLSEGQSRKWPTGSSARSARMPASSPSAFSRTPIPPTRTTSKPERSFGRAPRVPPKAAARPPGRPSTPKRRARGRRARCRRPRIMRPSPRRRGAARIFGRD